MKEIVFLVEESPEGGYIARALDESIFTEAEDLDALRVGTLSAVPLDVARRLDRTKDDLARELFG